MTESNNPLQRRTITVLFSFVENYLKACREYPNALVRVSR